jgi:hypothetical protein
MSCGTVCTASTRCFPVWHTPRYYAGRHLPCHASRPPSSPTRVTTALNGTAFQAKGGEAFSRRGSIQKNPQACTARMWTWRWPPLPRMAIRCHEAAPALARSPLAARPPQAGTRPSPAPQTTHLREGRPRGHAPTMAVTLPGGRRSVEGERTGHADGASAVLPGPCCVRATAHVSCRLAPGRGETLEGVSPSPSPPWGSTWAISCVHATARPSVQRSPGAGVTADAQLSIRRGSA